VIGTNVHKLSISLGVLEFALSKESAGEILPIEDLAALKVHEVATTWSVLDHPVFTHHYELVVKHSKPAL
jgi:hypothetical protein